MNIQIGQVIREHRKKLGLSAAGSSEAVYDKVRGELLTMFREDEETFGFMRDSREWEELLA